MYVTPCISNWLIYEVQIICIQHFMLIDHACLENRLAADKVKFN